MRFDSYFDFDARAYEGAAAAARDKRTRARSCLSPIMQRHERLSVAIRALDAHSACDSYRIIAEAPFGKKANRGGDWKTHDLRNQTVRLV